MSVHFDSKFGRTVLDVITFTPRLAWHLSTKMVTSSAPNRAATSAGLEMGIEPGLFPELGTPFKAFPLRSKFQPSESKGEELNS